MSAGLRDLLERVAARHPGADLDPIRRAHAVLVDDATGATRQATALRCADTLTELRIHPVAIAACLLRYVGEPPDLAWVREHLGADVARLVDGVRRVDAVHWGALARESGETLRRMFMAMAADVRVVVIVLTARLESMRALREDPDAETRRRVAHETLDIFAPLANRLGIARIKWELEDLALRELEPEVYAQLKRDLAEKRRERDAYVERVMDTLRTLLAEHGIRGEVTGRPKHIYSIYTKMRRKGVDFEQIYDVTAVRVLVPEIKDCYAMLGLVHGAWVPIPGEFDDYIARPKPNFYQSLHTAVGGPDGKSVEIQIRTHEMHQFAEFGIAAHWAYKEGRKGRQADAQFDLLRQLVSWQDELSEEDKAKLAEDIFADRVYALTPEGDVVDLPARATALDFAYRVHTMIGHRCRGAKVNGQIVPLDRPLHTGDRVEVLTRKLPEPSRDWLDPRSGYLQSAAARQKVRQWFRQQDKDDDANEDADEARAAPEPAPEPPVTVPTELPAGKRTRAAAGVRVDGIGNVLSQPARCCNPVPGDPVIGYITRGRGIVIHHRECPNVTHSQEPERLIDIDWGGEDRRAYPVTLRVTVLDQPGSFRDVADVISSMGINISASKTHSRAREDAADVTLTLEIRESDQIERVLQRLERLPVVLDARRR